MKYEMMIEKKKPQCNHGEIVLKLETVVKELVQI